MEDLFLYVSISACLIPILSVIVVVFFFHLWRFDCWCRAPFQLDVDNSVGGAAARCGPARLARATVARTELQMAAAALTARRLLKCPAQEHSLLRVLKS